MTDTSRSSNAALKISPTFFFLVSLGIHRAFKAREEEEEEEEEEQQQQQSERVTHRAAAAAAAAGGDGVGRGGLLHACMHACT